MKIILKEGEEAKEFFENLVNRVAENIVIRFENRILEIQKTADSEKEQWVSPTEAKLVLGIKSNKKLQSLRDSDAIRFSQHGRIIRYYKPSLYEFLERNVVR